MPTTTEYINQYFKMKIIILLNRAIQHDKYFQFKIQVSVFRSGWHLCFNVDRENLYGVSGCQQPFKLPIFFYYKFLILII